MLSRVAVLICALGLSACASTDPSAGFEGLDPYENTNRKIHNFNVTLDRNFLRPVGQGYDFVTPTLFQHVIGNGLNHIDLTNDFANYLFQGELKAASRSLGRFTLNTVLGLGGLLDPATEFGLPKEDTDFGVTLGKWGVDSGAFLMLPFLGPSSPRDLGGFIVDRAFDPGTYLGTVTGGDLYGPITFVVGTVDQRARNADLIDDVLYNSADSYVTLRSIYFQRRNAQITGGADTDALPDIFDDEDTQ
ncbi:MAG: VacJ family lipoprotein [Pseudomonadota bacterium]